jgi:hypothetical protein
MEAIMAKMNMVQFQPGMSLAQFNEHYGSESLCEQAVERARWPQGYTCAGCGHLRCYVVRHGAVKTFQCCLCHRQTTLTSGTIFQHSKLPLTKWLLAMYLLTQSKNNVSALELKRMVGVCYRTAWRLKHKILAVMTRCEADRKLEGTVVVDDAYLGGKHHGKSGRGSENKVAFIAAVQTNAQGSPQYVLFSRVKTFGRADVDAWAARHLAPASTIVSDGLNCFTALAHGGRTHQREVVGSTRKSSAMPCFKWINTLLGNLKTATRGTYHAFKFDKYGGRYLAEAQCRFNRRFDLADILRCLLFDSVRTAPHSESELRLAEDQR